MVKIARSEWDRLSADEKWDVVYRHCTITEGNFQRHAAVIKGLHERLEKLETSLQENPLTSD